MQSNRACDNHYAENLYASLGKLVNIKLKSKHNNDCLVESQVVDEEKMHMMPLAESQVNLMGETKRSHDDVQD